MTEYLFYFTNGGGSADAQSPAGGGASFRVKDIPRQLRGGCGLCIYLSCEPGEEQKWILPGQTEALFRVAGDDYQLLAQFPPQA